MFGFDTFSSGVFLQVHWGMTVTVIVLAFGIYLSCRYFIKSSAAQQAATDDKAIEILKQRYTKVEITSEEYERLNTVLMT